MKLANKFYTPDQAAQVAANLLAEDAYLAALVSRNHGDALMAPGKGGAPIAIPAPAALYSRARDLDDVTNAIVLDYITETVLTVNLARTLDYSAVGLSEADVSLNITDFTRQVLARQTEAVAEGIEARVAAHLLAVPGLGGESVPAVQMGDVTTEAWTTEALPAWNEAEPTKYMTQIRKILRQRGVPQAGLVCLVGTNVYGALLDAEAIERADAAGTTEALREGNVGKVRGFTVVESTRIGDDEILAFHKDAVTLATRAPQVPAGCAFGAVANERGYSLRYLRDYDAAHTQDRSIVGTFVGVADMPLWRVERDWAGKPAKDGAGVATPAGTVTAKAYQFKGVVHVEDVTAE